MAFIPRDPWEEKVIDGHIRNGWNDGRLGRKRTIGKCQGFYDNAYAQGEQYAAKLGKLPFNDSEE